MNQLDTMSAAEYLEYCKTGKLPGKKQSALKYHNRRMEYGGRIFDSQREANRAADLELMVRAGEIAKVLYQVPFELPGGVMYKADFVRLNMDGTWSVEDAKGVRTKEYRIKAKLFHERYGREIVEV